MSDNPSQANADSDANSTININDAPSTTHDADNIPDAFPDTPNVDPALSIVTPQVTTNYQLTWRGSPNYWSGRNGYTITAIVDHIMQSSIASADAWFKNQNSEVSAHFGVARDGTIYQWVRTENTAWSNGIFNHPDTGIGWLGDAFAKNIDPNYFTLSIEHEGYTGNAFPETQYQATLWLHKHLITNYGITVDRQHIVGHYKIDSINRINCPGTGFPWTRLFQDLASLVQNPPTPPAPTQPKLVQLNFGPGTVLIDGAFVRANPSFGSDGTVLRRLAKGTVLKFVAYLDGGPVYQGGSRWYQIAPANGGGWIHSKQIG
jgi:N-acetyl-anhydromuramyl-L-alanine amidase AmpD